MIPIITAVSAASQVANPETKKVATIAVLLSIAAIGFGIYKISDLIFKPFDKIVSVDGQSDERNSPEFTEPGEDELKPLLKQKPVAPPQVMPPTKIGWKGSNYEVDRDVEERFFNCM